VPYAYLLRLDENEREILEELEVLPKYNHLSRNDVIITAIKELSKKEFV
jgi:hypothetical protein